MAVEAARDALTGRDRSCIAGAALCLHDVSVPRPPQRWHRRRRRWTCPRTHLRHRHRRDPARGDLGADRGAARAARRNAGRGRREARRQGGEPGRDGEPATAPRPCWSGEGEPVARLLARPRAPPISSITSARSTIQFDYQWEERWIRDAGYMPIVPPVIKRCLEAAGLRPPRT